MAIGIIDMNGAVSWDVIREARSRADGGHAPTLAFGPHVDIENRRAAKAAGVGSHCLQWPVPQRHGGSDRAIPSSLRDGALTPREMRTEERRNVLK